MYQVPLAGTALSSANIGIETTITSGNVSCDNISATNGTINNLTTTIFNPVSITTSTIDTQNLIVGNSITELNVQTLNVSNKNTSQMNASNISATNISATSITADNVQPLLTAGTNVKIINNVISATNEALLPSDANFSSVDTDTLTTTSLNTSTLNSSSLNSLLLNVSTINTSSLSASNISTAEMNFGSNLTYNVSKTLDVNTTSVISSGNTQPITSGAVYNAINTSVNNIATIWSYMSNEPELVVVTSQVNSGNLDTICYVDITPKYYGSKIHVEFCYSYSVGGFGGDTITTAIQTGTNNNTVQTQRQELFQIWTNQTGGGTRSGTGNTISASYTNTDAVGKYHRIKLRVDNTSDDTWSLSNNNYISVKIIEFIEVAGVSNPNLYLGTGNISCGNISCSSITLSNQVFDNINSTYDANIGGQFITLGFPQSGVIVSDSTLRMAGGSVLLNYADTTWNGTTYNISTRQSGTNFAISFGQNKYFEVDEINVSIQSMLVNQNMEVLGTLDLNNLILNDSLAVNGSFTATNGSFQNASFQNVDIQMLNVSNVSITNNVSIAGSITANNLSTGSLVAGNNVSIINNVISAYVEGGTDWNISSLHVDNDVGITGNLNVSETSIFEQSLNVNNQLFIGKAGDLDGNLVLYSTIIGDNFQIKNIDESTSFLGNGNISRFNFSLGGNQTLAISPTGINVSGDITFSGSLIGNLEIGGTLNVSHVNASNISTENFSATNMTGTQLTTTSHVETGKWWIGASNSATASLYNKDITSVTTHYALHHTNGGGTFLNGTAIYFQNLASNVGEWNSTGLSIGKTNPTKILDVLGNSLFIGDVEIGGTLNVSHVNSSNMSTENFSATNMTGTQLTTTSHVETGKWWIGASNSATASLYNKDITSTTTHYALHHTNGGGTFLNGTAIYFQNLASNVGEWNSTGLSIGKTNPTKILDVLGNSLFTGSVNVCGTLYANSLSSTTGSITTLNATDVNATGTIDTFELIADESTINFLTVLSNFTTDEVLCDNLHVNISALIDAPLFVKGATNLSGKLNVSNDMSITGDIFAEEFVGTLTTTLLNVPTINVSTLNVSDIINNTEFVSPLINASTINSSTLNTNFVLCPSLLNVSYLFSNGTLELKSANLPTLTMNNTSAKFYQDVNVSGKVSADSFGNINSSNINCSTLTLSDTIGAGGLDVTGASYFRTDATFYSFAYFQEQDTYFGEPAGTDTRSRINFWSQKAAGEIGVKFGCDSDDIVRLNLPRFGLYTQYNINISNISTMDMDNTSTKFHQNVNISGILNVSGIQGLTNVCSTNISTSNLSTNKITFYTTYGLYNDFTGAMNVSLNQVKTDILSALGTTFSSQTLNSSTLNSSVIKTNGLYIQDLGASINFSAAGILNNNQTGCVTNLATCNISKLNASNISAINISISNDLEVDGVLDTLNLLATDATITTLDSTTINVSTINSSNLSTGAILFSSDFQFALNTLSLAPSETSSAIQAATIASLATQVNSSDGNFSTLFADFAIIGGALNANSINVSTLNFSTSVGENVSISNLSVSGNMTSGNMSFITNAGNVLINTTNYDFWLGQSSTGFTTIIGNGIWLNSAVGVPTLKLNPAGVAIFDQGDVIMRNALNVSNVNFSNAVGDSLTTTLLNNHSNYMRYYRDSFINLTSSQTSYDIQYPSTGSNGQKTNTNLITINTNNDAFTIVKAGYYRFFASQGVFNVTYADRVVWRLRPVVNGTTNNTYSQLFCYTRHNAYGNRGTITGQVIQYFTVGMVVRMRVDVGKASFNSNFGSVMDGLQIQGGGYIEIQYLGDT